MTRWEKGFLSGEGSFKEIGTRLHKESRLRTLAHITTCRLNLKTTFYWLVLIQTMDYTLDERYQRTDTLTNGMKRQQIQSLGKEGLLISCGVTFLAISNNRERSRLPL